MVVVLTCGAARMLRIFLLVMMTHLWCVEECQTVPLSVPCVWTRYIDECGQGEYFFVVRKPGKVVVATVIDTYDRDLIHVIEENPDRDGPFGEFYVPQLRPLEHGEVLGAHTHAKGEGGKSGSALYTSDNRKKGCILIKPPGENAQTVSVDLQNATKTNVLCEYSAQEHHFIITKPLVEYGDKSQFFVRLKIAYTNTKKPIMMWGKRGLKTDEGSFQEWDIEQKIFDFCPQDKPSDPNRGAGDYVRTRSSMKAASSVKSKGLRKTGHKSPEQRGRRSSARGGVKRLQN